MHIYINTTFIAGSRFAMSTYKTIKGISLNITYSHIIHSSHIHSSQFTIEELKKRTNIVHFLKF
jgi:hypothetical protein